MKKYPNINARAILKRHNRWRRGAEIPQEHPKMLGDAIDLICREHQEMEKALKEISKIHHNKLTSGIEKTQIIVALCFNDIKRRKGIIK
jgi:hypothetical protein